MLVLGIPATRSRLMVQTAFSLTLIHNQTVTSALTIHLVRSPKFKRCNNIKAAQDNKFRQEILLVITTLAATEQRVVKFNS